jgi:hypothetical protein
MFFILVPITKHIAFNIQNKIKYKSYYTKNMLKIRFIGYTIIGGYSIIK